MTNREIRETLGMIEGLLLINTLVEVMEEIMEEKSKQTKEEEVPKTKILSDRIKRETSEIVDFVMPDNFETEKVVNKKVGIKYRVIHMRTEDKIVCEYRGYFSNSLLGRGESDVQKEIEDAEGKACVIAEYKAKADWILASANRIA